MNSNSKTLTYKEFKTQWTVDRKVRVPTLLIRSGPDKLSRIPTRTLEQMNQILQENPGYTQVYFDEDDLYQFLIDYYPDLFLEQGFSLNDVYWLDLWRLLVVYTYGGVYSEYQSTHVRSMKALIGTTDEIVFCVDKNGTGLHTGFFASYPASHVIRYMILHIRGNVRTRKQSGSVLSGSVAWALALNRYLQRGESYLYQRGFFCSTDARITFVELLDEYIVNTHGTPCLLVKHQSLKNFCFVA